MLKREATLSGHTIWPYARTSLSPCSFLTSDLPAAYIWNGPIDKREWVTGGVNDQSKFKSSERYWFDSLIFEQQHLEALHLYIRNIRPHFESKSENILIVTRHGKKTNQTIQYSWKIGLLGDLQIYQPYEATPNSGDWELNLSEDQKHTSNVAKVKYKKLGSRDVATKAKEALATIGKRFTLSLSPIGNSVSEHNSTTTNIKTEKVDATKRSPQKKVPFSRDEDTCLFKGIQQMGSMDTNPLRQ